MRCRVRSRRYELGVLSLILTTLISPAQVNSQNSTLRAPIDRAMSCYARLQYDCVLEELADFNVGAASEVLDRRMVQEAAKVLAVSYIISGMPDQARRIFSDLLLIWPDYRLEGEELSPRFFAVFRQAHAEASGKGLAPSVLAGAEAISLLVGLIDKAALEALETRGNARQVCVNIVARERTTTIPGPDLRVGLGLAFQPMTGTDRDTFDDSFGVSARLSTDRFFGFSFSLAFDRHLHEVHLNNLVTEVPPELQIMNIVAGISYPVQLESSVRLGFGVAAGYTTFGYTEVSERGGFLADLVIDASVSMPSGLGIGAELRPRFAVVEGIEGLEVSTPVQFALHILYDFHFD